MRAEAEAAARAALASARTADDLVALLSALDAVVARGIEAGRPEGPRAACAPGCSACCAVNVGTLAVEGAAAAAWIRGRLAEAEAAALAARLAAFHGEVRWLEDRERIAGRLTCPLLDRDGRCTIHPVRPLACRAISSLDAEDCRRAMSDSDVAPVVRMDLLQRALYETAHLALAEETSRRGLDARPRDVSGMMAAFLADPGLARAFLSGDRLPVE